MIPAMPWGAMPMAPPSVGGQQLTQRGEQVGVAARPGLDHRETGGGMRHPHMQQAVAGAHLVEERSAFRGEVAHLFARAGLDLEFLGVHADDGTALQGVPGNGTVSGVMPATARQRVARTAA